MDLAFLFPLLCFRGVASALGSCRCPVPGGVVVALICFLRLRCCFSLLRLFSRPLAAACRPGGGTGTLKSELQNRCVQSKVEAAFSWESLAKSYCSTFRCYLVKFVQL
jgi:hypothetical protein